MNQYQVIRDMEKLRRMIDRTLSAIPEDVRAAARQRPVWDEETGRKAVVKRWTNHRERMAALKAGGQGGDPGDGAA
jgi:hypothetical protein